MRDRNFKKETNLFTLRDPVRKKEKYFSSEVPYNYKAVNYRALFMMSHSGRRHPSFKL